MTTTVINTIEETRTIKTEKLSDGKIIRTETIVTKAVDEKALEAHLAFARPSRPDTHLTQSFFESLFGKVKP